MATDIVGISEQLASLDQLLSALQASDGSLCALPLVDAQVTRVPEDLLPRLRSHAASLGTPLVCVDATTQSIVCRSHDDCLAIASPELIRQATETDSPRVWAQSGDHALVSIPLATASGRRFVAVGCVLGRPGARPHELVLAAADQNWSQAKLDHWLSELPSCDPRTLERFVATLTQADANADRHATSQRQLEDLSAQLEYTYEEISLLHGLTQNLQISKAPSELAWLALKRLNNVLLAEGHAVWLNDRRSAPQFLIHGQVPFGSEELLTLVARFEHRNWQQPLVQNHVEAGPLGAEFPGLRNFVLVPIAEGEHCSGWLCSCNTVRGEEFGTVQANLLASVGTILGTHTRNRDLYQQHEEMQVGFVRSLVSSLDAKDPYTRGHSERVALVARRLAAQLNLSEEDLRQIYLSGLLHDIGKIGVDDQILRKPDQLTPEEFEQVKKHPMIGYQILVGLKNLQPVIPGVRHHHEAWNGTGYPDGLAGEDIPLMARILAVADSYDAMGSDRPYRNGMPRDVLEAIFRRGSGMQWDPRVVAAYFEVRDEIRSICESHVQDPSAGLALPEMAAGWLPQSVIRSL